MTFNEKYEREWFKLKNLDYPHNEKLIKWAEDDYIKEKEVNKSMAKEYEAVNHPSHYTSGNVECIDGLKAATVGLEGIEAVCTANAIKYLWRWKLKNGVQDLDKAIWYIERLKKEIDESTNL